jgi:hypothetical protein
MSYRDNIDALAARHAALETEVAHKTRELDTAARILDEARTKARLPVLDNIRIASPCSADWSKMIGDERARFCGDCKKTVYNISEMTRDDAEALLIEKEGKLCMRYYQRADGTILLKDCVVGVKRKRKRRIIVAGAAALLAGGTAYWVAMKREQHVETIVGDVAVEAVQGGAMMPDEPVPDPHEAPHAQAKDDQPVQARLGR